MQPFIRFRTLFFNLESCISHRFFKNLYLNAAWQDVNILQK
jgi:hypothetical protein